MHTMRRLMALMEGWDSTLPLDNGNLVDIYRNPSRAEFHKLLKQYGSLRGEIDENGDLLAWDAHVAVHSEIAHHHSKRYARVMDTYLYLHNDHVVMNDINYHTEESGDSGYGPLLARKAELVFSNQYLHRIYGGVPKVVGTDNVNDEEHVLTPALLARIANERPDRISDLS
jgi:hypothetical protein